MTTLEALEIGRARIADPKDWAKGDGSVGGPPEPCRCAVTALPRPKRISGAVALCGAIGVDATVRVRGFYEWHDAPERTHAEILAAYDKAIATERSKANG